MIDAQPIIDEVRALGFALAGVAEARSTDHAEALRDWLAAGAHGEMAWLERNCEVIADPSRLLPGAQSIICVADRYSHGRADRTHQGGFGRIARYARGRDYHRVMERRLRTLVERLQEAHPEEGFRLCVDAAPLLEREHAERAGLGAVGKHTLLIERGAGSWMLLGEILTTLSVRPTTVAPPAEQGGRTMGDPCGSCTRCIDACPTDAITPYRVDATRCISYLTIEHRSLIDPALHAGIGEWIFGCDVCQEVCPHGRPTRRSRRLAVHEAYAPRREGFDLLEVLGWSEEDRRAAFETSALKRAKLEMMKRNALIVAGNQILAGVIVDPAPLRRRIEALASSTEESALVQQTARQVLDRIRTAD